MHFFSFAMLNLSSLFPFPGSRHIMTYLSICIECTVIWSPVGCRKLSWTWRINLTQLRGTDIVGGNFEESLIFVCLCMWYGTSYLHTHCILTLQVACCIVDLDSFNEIAECNIEILGSRCSESFCWSCWCLINWWTYCQLLFM